MTARVEFRKPYPVVRLTPDAITQIIELREQGWSYRKLALRFGVSPGAIHYQCLRAGAVSPHQRPGGVSRSLHGAP